MTFKYLVWTYFPNKNTQDIEKHQLKNQNGQSLVEFVLLLSVIMLISLLFFKAN
jgi:hypothetical protein